MKFKMASILLIVFSLLIVFNTQKAYSQDDQLSMDDLKKITTPGEMHKHLEQLIGKWKQSIILNNGAEPMYAKGETENSMIYGGRFIEMYVKREVLEQPFLCRQFLGYDARKEKYFIFIIDELGTYPIYAEGKYDSVLKKFTFNGVQEAFANMKRAPFRIEIQIERENKYTQRTFFMVGKKEKVNEDIMCIKEPE